MEHSAPSPTPTTGGNALLAGGFAAIFASACCLGPLACEPGQACAAPNIKRAYKVLFGVVVALLVLALGFPLIAAWFH